MCRNAKRNKLKNDCEKCKGKSAKIWKVINKVTHKKSKQNTVPDFVEVRGADGELKKVRDEKEIANEINRQFTQMGSKLAEKLTPTDANFYDYLKSPSKTSIYLKRATESEVGNIFHEINAHKAHGYDETPPKVLKWGD